MTYMHMHVCYHVSTCVSDCHLHHLTQPRHALFPPLIRRAVGLLLSRHLGPPDRLRVESGGKKHRPGSDKGPEADVTLVLTLDYPGELQELRPLAEGE
jgi:hypothetical protein